MKRLLFPLLCILLLTAAALAQANKPLLMRDPTLSKTQIVFSYAGDLWVVSREGGEATRLTNGLGNESPRFSPDVRWIAFTGQYDGNTDVYVIPATGGVPRRLTYHPGNDSVVGWTPDSKQVLFVSGPTVLRVVTRVSSRWPSMASIRHRCRYQWDMKAHTRQTLLTWLTYRCRTASMRGSTIGAA